MRQRIYGRKAKENQKRFILTDKSPDRQTNPTYDEGLVNENSDDEKDSSDDNETQHQRQHQ